MTAKLGSLRESLTFRVVVTFSTVTFVVTAALLATLFWFAVHLPMERVKREVAAEAEAIAALYVRSGAEPAAVALEQRRAQPSQRMAFDALIVGGRTVTTNLPSWPARRTGRWLRIEADLYRDGDEDDHEALARDVQLRDGSRLIMGRDVEAIADRQELIVEAAAWAVLLVLVLGMAGGLVLSRIIGRRLERVSRTALMVMAGNLSERIETAGTNDDFDQLNRTLNTMLDRIQELVGSVSRVSDSIAHDLRTPLTRLHATLEQLQRDPAPQTVQHLAEKALGEANGLQRIFDALLRIARLESGRHQLQWATVSLSQLAEDAADLYGPEAEAKQQCLVVDAQPQLTLSADRDLLFQALVNLVDNAIKFTPAGGTIEISATGGERAVELAVRDSGGGVDPSSVGRLGERFYRAPGSERAAGTGLGLALASAVARAHEGELVFASESDGFEARILLPATSSNKAM